MRPVLVVDGLVKRFRLHHRGGVELSVLEHFHLSVAPGECVVLSGPSGSGKSTLLRCIYGNYRADSGRIRLDIDGRVVEIAGAHHRVVQHLRRHSIGYVSQFLRAIPRVAALDVVAEPLRRIGLHRDLARARAGELLASLAIPEKLWDLPPGTFSGGEQQRVNIARGFAVEFPLLLLDEPSSALDAGNRERLRTLIESAKTRGAALIGVFHDRDLADAVGTRVVAMSALAQAA
jgi:alpha-D-ribose 1-methylphosphonate 5-triphosphate synthase subunit PhnL